MGKTGLRLRVLIWSSLMAFFFVQPVSANQIEEINQFRLESFLPILVAFGIAIPVWKIFIPNQLANLQVAFEIDDDLYEVHKITGSVSDARILLKQGTVGYGIGLYMMGMTGILILIMELLFNPNVYFEASLLLAGMLIAIPVLISPWETLNAQILGKSNNKSKRNRITGFVRRIVTLSFLIGARAIEAPDVPSICAALEAALSLWPGLILLERAGRGPERIV